MTKLRCGLIQMGLKSATDNDPETIRKAMIDAHLPLIEQAGKQGVQVLSLQEVFTQPYFCPSQDTKWYEAAEKIPDGPTTKLMQELAAKYKMVIVVPIYEEHMTGVYYNTAAVIDADGSYLGKYRKTHMPQVAGFWEKFFFKPGTSNWPVFNTAYCKLGVYICYDRHFPEGWRALALNGAEYVVGRMVVGGNVGASVVGAAVANGMYIGAINRVGTEAPWNIGEFYGQSYFVNPRGEIETIASRDQDELLVHELDMSMVRQVRNTWQFFRDRRPEAYVELTHSE